MQEGRLRHPDWRVEGRDWPHRDHSRFVEQGGIRWHVQVFGSGPTMLLVHGTGASGHSFRDLAPLLAERHTVVVPDLPGHGFSRAPRSFRPSLPGMAAALAALLPSLGPPPRVVVGHSAGAAVLARMTLDHSLEPALLVGLGAAIMPLRGPGTWLFAPAARLLGRSESAARLIALQADARAVSRMIAGTGSLLDARGVDLYRRLASSAGHVSSVLAMLAAWDVAPLVAVLGDLRTRVLLVVGAHDKATPPGRQRDLAAHLPEARVEVVRRAGHLVHEERPDVVAQLILDEVAGDDAGTAPHRPVR